MKLRAFVLIPAHLSEDEGKFTQSSFEVGWSESNDECILDILRINCPSISNLPDTIANYFDEVIRRSPSETNIQMAKYLGMMQVLLREAPGDPIPGDVLNILHQFPEFSFLQADSGRYFLFKDSEMDSIETTVRKSIGRY